jgi:hypothetical protein
VHRRSSGLGDLEGEVLAGDLLRFGPAADAGVECVDRGDLVGGELEVDTSKFSAIREGVTDLGIACRPCCTCQHNITSAGALPWARAISPMTGSAKVLPWEPSR